MSAGKFTPGKWEIYPKNFETRRDTFASLCVGVNGDVIVRITESAHYYATPEQIANAKLIAAAPSQYEALLKMVARAKDVANSSFNNMRHALDCMDDAVKEAEAAIQLATE